MMTPEPAEPYSFDSLLLPKNPMDDVVFVKYEFIDTTDNIALLTAFVVVVSPLSPFSPFRLFSHSSSVPENPYFTARSYAESVYIVSPFRLSSHSSSVPV